MDKDSYFQEKISLINLLQQTISGKEFEECELSDCNFESCKFIKCKFISCKFTNCMFSAISAIDCRFVDVSFQNSKVMGFDWTTARQVQNLILHNCQINYSNFKLMSLPKLVLTHCEAKEVDFTGAHLQSSDFTGSNFENAIFSNTDLSQVNFQGAKNYFIDLKSNNIKNASFSLPEVISLLDSLQIKVS